MMRAAANLESVPVKRIAHAAISVALQALHNDVRCISRGAILPECEPRRLAGNTAIMDVLYPRDICEVPLSTGEEKANG